MKYKSLHISLSKVTLLKLTFILLSTGSSYAANPKAAANLDRLISTNEATPNERAIDKLNLLTVDIPITGKVTDDKTGQPLAGVTVRVKGTTIATMTDGEGNYRIKVPDNNSVLVFTMVSFEETERSVGSKTLISTTLKEKLSSLNEVIVVGFGQQKKESVVGSIAQVSGKVLERTGGVTSLGAALTGNIPGLVTTATTGMPGDENPNILIRAQTSFNGSSPLVLIDNIKRSLNDIDINSVATISVLKDASATAVFGVEGANGVILITTKRGQVGTAKVDINVNTTAKTVSRLPNKYDAYDALKIKNMIVEYELSTVPGVWAFATPQPIIDLYRNQNTQEQRERYPNIDWQDYMFRNFALSTNPNVNISGGSKIVKYFANVDYVHEGDLFKTIDIGRGYTPKFEYNRLNTRTNLDFQLSKTTVFKANLAGSYGVRSSPGGVNSDNVSNYMSGLYFMAGDVFYPRYSDGSWGYYPPAEVETPNPAKDFATNGVLQRTDTRLYTDFVLQQDLSFITKGLKFQGTLAWDYNFRETGRGATDGADLYRKYIDPKSGLVSYKYLLDANTNFDWVPQLTWSSQGGTMDDGFTTRNLNYQFQLNYAKTIAQKHNVTLMGNFLRRQGAQGNNIPNYREDWVFRTTYNYANKYLIEYNGAYNGSERFSPEYRFAFFSSGALGWLLSEEKFIKNLKWIDVLKIRASYGKIGDDSGGRFLYSTLWQSGGNTKLGINPGAAENSPYTWLKQSQIGNPNVHWETVTKKNLGLDYSFFNGLIAGSVDVFQDYRTDILIAGGSRGSVPSYFGAAPPTANQGRVKANGYEFEIRVSKTLSKGARLWMNANMTYAKDKIEYADDPGLRQDYRKRAGYANGQATSYLSSGYYNSWDDLYGTTPYVNNDTKIPGGLRIVDFDGDGVIDFDQVPYGYSGNPQHTMSVTLGTDWKGFSAFVQLYGVNNVSRYVDQSSFTRTYRNTAYDVGTYWSKDNPNADSQVPRLFSYPNGSYMGDQFMYDGSYIRIKNAELAYSFTGKWVKKAGVTSLRMFINGNNLWMWSRMPDDRESNTSGGTVVNNAYPTVRRYNLGARISL